MDGGESGAAGPAGDRGRVDRKGGHRAVQRKCVAGLSAPGISSNLPDDADPPPTHRPYTPRTNGKAERFIQTALREWARAKHWASSEERDASLKHWTDYYNLQRPHGSLNYKPPISRSDIGTTS